jgi:hypothetical protein
MKNPPESSGMTQPASHGLTSEFTPSDFIEVLRVIKDECAIAGGQAVSWWSIRYSLAAGDGPSGKGPVTSSDIDLWGGREDVLALARKLGRKAILPGPYDMTVWSGAVPLEIQGHRSVADFLHTIPGLDTVDDDKASLRQELAAGQERIAIKILSPVSMVFVKLHALRHFDQSGRNDLVHLRVCLKAANSFIAELLADNETRSVLSNCERLISLHGFKPTSRLESVHGFRVLSGIPIEAIRDSADNKARPLRDRERLAGFYAKRWPQVAQA